MQKRIGSEYILGGNGRYISLEKHCVEMIERAALETLGAPLARLAARRAVWKALGLTEAEAKCLANSDFASVTGRGRSGEHRALCGMILVDKKYRSIEESVLIFVIEPQQKPTY